MRTRIRKSGLLLVALLAMQLPLRFQAQAAEQRDMRLQCAEFVDRSIEGVALRETAVLSTHKGLPPFCAIRGTIEPSIGFEARFPLDGWNGKYYQSGCGGFCGAVLPDKEGYSNTINQALIRGYATITTDGGHSAWLGDASWAVGNPVAVDVYAQSAIPLTHAAGTRMAKAFYGEEPRLDYFSGCSNGGRMAAIAAQRYPDLFDGILGGGSVLDLSRSGGVFGSWVVQSNTRPDGQRILRRENFDHKLPALEAAVAAQCDGRDGRSDGLISLPRNCEVDVSALPGCVAAETADCFTQEEKAVLQRWYQGPRDSSGKQLFPGMPPGSERYWLVWFLDTREQVAPGNGLGGDYARFLGFEGGAADGFTALDFDFDQDPARLEASGRLLDALDADLSAFRDAGGKFLMWHGWQDPLVLPDQSVRYYQSVLEMMGGKETVDSFFRLFMIPGQGHCWELPSPAPDQFNPIEVLENWVEHGRPPDYLLLSPRPGGNPTGSAAVVLCPHPGSAIPADAAGNDLGIACSRP